MTSGVEERQRQYYEQTARLYDSMHLEAGDEHYRALRYISCFLDLLQATSILDVGCGTGRGIGYFLSKHPGMAVHGIEPVGALVEQAVNANKIPRELITQATGEHLPFPDNSFDIVCALAVMHHLPRPERVLTEMTRVARKAVFISDGNRFGSGRFLIRLTKLLLFATKLWKPAILVRTGGRGYSISQGDGLAYSYSVFDSFACLSRWAGRMIAIPTGRERASNWLHPLLTSHHILLCALRDEEPGADRDGTPT